MADRAIVVGGTSGLGLGVAREFLRQGCEVTIGSRSHDKISQALDSLGGAAIGSTVDATDETSLSDFFSAAGRFNYLVITAAEAFADRPLLETKIDDFRAFAETKLWGTLRTLQAALRADMADGASIVLVSGAVARKGRSGAHAKSMVNGALESLTRSMAVELGSRARINCVSPGIFDSRGAMPAAKKDEFKQMYPAGYVGNSEDVAAIVYATAANRFVTGSIVSVDGGWTAT